MGQSQSDDKTDEDSITLGYRILGVQPNSPASEANLVSVFDFIVGARGVPLKAQDNTIVDMIKDSADTKQPLVSDDERVLLYGYYLVPTIWVA